MKLLVFILLVAGMCFAGGMVADIYVNVENETASISSILVSYGDRIFVPPGSDYSVRTYGNGSEFTSQFSIPKDVIFYDSPSEGGAKVFEQNPVELFLPFYGDSQMLEIRRGNKTLLSTRLEPYLCNHNGICENGENTLICKSDCPSGMADGFCDNAVDGKCDPDCISEYDLDYKAAGINRSFLDVSGVNVKPTKPDKDYDIVAFAIDILLLPLAAWNMHPVCCIAPIAIAAVFASAGLFRKGRKKVRKGAEEAR